MSNLEFEITGLVVAGFPGYEACVIQAAKDPKVPSDLVVRVRFPMFVRKSPNGTRHALTTESRLTGGTAAEREMVRQWVDDVVIPDSIRLAHVESRKAGMRWPPSWPVPTYQNVLENAAAQTWRRRKG